MAIPNSFFWGGDRDLLGADYGGGFGARMTQADEAALADSARQAAALRLGRFRGGYDPTIGAQNPTASLEQLLFPTTQPGALPPLVMPGLASPNMQQPVASAPQGPFLSPGVRPDQFGGGFPAGGPAPAPTPQVAPQQAAQSPQPDPMNSFAASPGYAPQQQQQPAGNWLSNNSNMLMALGAGIAGGRDWGQGISMGLQGAMMGRKADSSQQAQQAIYQAVYRQTGDHNKAILAASNPDASKFVMEQIYGPKKPAGTFEIGGAKLPYTLNADGSAQFIVPGGNGGPASLGSVISYLQTVEAEGKRQNAKGEAEGKAQGEAAATLPNTLAKADEALATIEKIRSHPGRDFATGAAGIAPGVPGTKQQDFISLLDQAKGQTFMQAYQSLKGGGQITEVEGKKATEAIGRLERSQTKEGFEAALNDLREVIKAGRARAGVVAGGNPTPAAETPSGGWQQVAPNVRIRERQ